MSREIRLFSVEVSSVQTSDGGAGGRGWILEGKERSRRSDRGMAGAESTREGSSRAGEGCFGAEGAGEPLLAEMRRRRARTRRRA